MSEQDPKKPRGRPKKLDTERTLDVAMEVYWSEDPVDVSLNEICKRAGVSKPSLYREFGNEDGFTCATLDRYAERVLSDIFQLLATDASLDDVLNQMIAFASRDPKMETGCLFYKMRAGKHRLGPRTRQRIEEIDAAAVEAYAAFLQRRRDAGELKSDLPIAMAARFLSEQIALALTQRASGEDKDEIEATLELALSVLRPS